MSRDLEYALMALNYMSDRQGDCISAKEMVKQLKCPFHPFSRVLQKLVNHKLITSRQGVRGGYVLTSNLEKLSLYQLMRAVLPPIEIADCLLGHCDLLQHCNIKSPAHYLNKKFLDFYKALNIKEILGHSDSKAIPWKTGVGRKTNKVLSL